MSMRSPTIKDKMSSKRIVASLCFQSCHSNTCASSTPDNGKELLFSGFPITLKMPSKGSKSIDLQQPGSPITAMFVPRFAPTSKAMDEFQWKVLPASLTRHRHNTASCPVSSRPVLSCPVPPSRRVLFCKDYGLGFGIECPCVNFQCQAMQSKQCKAMSTIENDTITKT